MRCIQTIIYVLLAIFIASFLTVGIYSTIKVSTEYENIEITVIDKGRDYTSGKYYITGESNDKIMTYRVSANGYYAMEIGKVYRVKVKYSGLARAKMIYGFEELMELGVNYDNS